jgi:hypothetical protein
MRLTFAVTIVVSGLALIGAVLGARHVPVAPTAALKHLPAPSPALHPARRGPIDT